MFYSCFSLPDHECRCAQIVAGQAMVCDLVCTHLHEVVCTCKCSTCILKTNTYAWQRLWGQIKTESLYVNKRSRPSLPISPVCRREPHLVHLCVQTIQFLGGGRRLVGPHCRGCWGRCATDKCPRRGWLAEGVDAGVVGVAVIVFHFGHGGCVGGEVARVDLSIMWRKAVGGNRQLRKGQCKYMFFMSVWASVCSLMAILWKSSEARETKKSM